MAGGEFHCFTVFVGCDDEVVVTVALLLHATSKSMGITSAAIRILRIVASFKK